MVSYRELAMRVVGKPLPLPNTNPRPVAHRATALALTAAMVAALASPAFAGWEIDMSKVTGDVTIEKSADGTTTISVGNDKLNVTDKNSGITGVKYTDEGNDKDITITDSRSKADGGVCGQSSTDKATATQEAREDAQPVVTDEEKSEPEPEASEQTPEAEDNTEESETPETPEATEDKADDPQGEADDEADGKEETETEPEPDGSTEGEAQPEGGAPAGDAEGQPAIDTMELKGALAPVAESNKDEETYDKAPTTFAEQVGSNLKAAVTNTTNAIIKIINKMTNKTDTDGTVTDNTLNVTLDGVKVDATGRNDSALTVEGEGNTTLTLKGENELKGGTGEAGLNQTGSGELTITGGASDKLTATGGNGNDSSRGNGDSGGAGISAGNLTISGGTISATGGKGGDTSDAYEAGGRGGAGIEGSTVTIAGSNTVIHVQGGAGDNGSGLSGGGGDGGDGIYGKEVTIEGGATVTNALGGAGGNGSAFGGRGGSGIYGYTVSIKENAKIEKAQGGSDGTGYGGTGGDGIYGGYKVEITDGSKVNAVGSDGIDGYIVTIKDNSKVNATSNGEGGSGIGSICDLTISGGNVEAKATGEHGTGIRGSTVSISSGTVNVTATGAGKHGSGIQAIIASITGGKTTIHGSSNGGSGININENLGTGINGKLEITSDAEVTIHMGENGRALTKTTPSSPGIVTEDINPASVVADNATLVIKDADGNIIYSNAPEPEPAPETPASSDSSSPAPEAVVITPAGVQGVWFTTLQGRSIPISADVRDTALVYTTLRPGVNLHTTLGTLRQLRAQGVTHITLRTLLHTTTFAIDELLAAHANDPDSTPVLVTHDGKSAKLAVGGVER